MSDKKENKARPLKQQCTGLNRQPDWLRPVVQAGFVVFSILLGLGFRSFILSLNGSAYEPVATRPPAVEAYLPISSLMTLVYFIKTGVLSRVHPAGLVIFSLTLLLALSVRRGFCSWVCPLGTAEEWAHKIGKKIVGTNPSMPQWLDIALRSFKYALLGFFLYSILLMPVAGLRGFIHGPYNRIADIKMYLFFSNIGTTALAVIIVLGFLSLLFKNFLCRYLCPYGALLGLFSMLSPAAIRRDADKCIDCGKCGQACPNRIAVDKKTKVISAECTACFSCVEACKVDGAIGFSLLRKKIGVSVVTYAAIILMAFFFSAQIAQVFNYWESETSAQTYKSLYSGINKIGHP
jgi:polyferredoxin